MIARKIKCTQMTDRRAQEREQPLSVCPSCAHRPLAGEYRRRHCHCHCAEREGDIIMMTDYTCYDVIRHAPSMLRIPIWTTGCARAGVDGDDDVMLCIWGGDGLSPLLVNRYELPPCYTNSRENQSSTSTHRTINQWSWESIYAPFHIKLAACTS